MFEQGPTNWHCTRPMFGSDQTINKNDKIKTILIFEREIVHLSDLVEQKLAVLDPSVSVELTLLVINWFKLIVTDK